MPIDGSLAFFLFLVDNSSELAFQQFYYPKEIWQSSESTVFENFYACGTGKEGFLQQVDNFGDFEEYNDFFKRGSFLRAFSTNLSLTARLLAAERISLFNIRKKWGAGFEIAYFNGEEFEKCDNYAYLIFSGSLNEEGDIDNLTPDLILHYRYVDSHLGITSLEPHPMIWTEDGDMNVYTSHIIKQNYHVVTPLQKKSIYEDEIPTDFSFETSTIAVACGLLLNKGGFYTPSYFNFAPHYLNIKFSYQNKLEVKVNKKVDATLRLIVKEQYPNIKD